MATVLTGCRDSSRRDGSAAASWSGSIDTIDGRIVVRNPAEPQWRDGAGWQLAPDLQIGAVDGTGPDVFGNIAAIAVSPDGAIAVLDGMAREIRLFAAEGRHVRTIGRHGSGPGELEGPLAVHFDSSGQLWVPDAGTGRYNVFDRDGTFITSMTRMAGVVLGNPGVMTRRDELIDPSLRVCCNLKNVS